jgi:hypothetical protein
VEKNWKTIMKHIHIQTLAFAAICGFVLTLAAGAVAQSSIQPGVVTAVRIVGEARYSLGDGKWHPLVAGKILVAGAVIQTGHDATVDVILGKRTPTMLELGKRKYNALPSRVSLAADANVRGYVSYRPLAEQNAIRMTGDTVLAIDKLNVSDTGVDTVGDTELDLRQGGIYCSVKKLSGASQYLIKIPNGIAGVRGTLFYIDATGRCIVYRNSAVLSITGPDGKPITVVVGEGNQFDPGNLGNGQPGPLSPGVSPLPPGVSPLPTGLGAELDRVFDALRTMYFPDYGEIQEINFPFDTTQSHISPTQGHQP